MADTKISALTASTTPLAGTEVLPIVQSGTTKKVSVDDLTTGKTVPVGVLSVTGTIPRITADMSNATQANRLMFQTTTANATSSVGVIPSGTGTSSRLNLFNSSDPDNAGYAQFNSSTAATIINSLKLGTGTTLPIRLQIDGSTQAELSTTGNLTLFTGNLVIGTSGKGIDFSANSGTAGMTSELLNWYEEGTWTPTQGAGLTVVGAFSSAGTYTRIGRLVTVKGNVDGATSIIVASGGILCGGLPFTSSGNSVGGLTVSNINQRGNVVTISSSIYSVQTTTADTSIIFTVTYNV